MTDSQANPPTLSAEMVRGFVIAGHGNLPKLKVMLEAEPALLNAAQEWRSGDTETALQAAAHVGNRAIAEYLLAQGAPLDICTAAMLGRRDEVAAFLVTDPALIEAHGAHQISLLTHAVLSGDPVLVEWLYESGARGNTDMALSLAVSRGEVTLARWLLANTEPDTGWTNMKGQTALDIARESGDESLIALLRSP